MTGDDISSFINCVVKLCLVVFLLFSPFHCFCGQLLKQSTKMPNENMCALRFCFIKANNNGTGSCVLEMKVMHESG